MKTTDFNKKITSSKLKENLNKQFGANVNLEKYSREQLEDIRNKLRTRVFQQESAAGINDLLTNEAYQKDKAMLQLLNTRIKEMLGEDIKKLKDKMVELSEAKKGVRAPKHKIHAQGTAAKDWDGDGEKESPKDEVWGSRAKAAAKAGKPFSEAAKPDFLDLDKDGNKKEPMKKAAKEEKVKEAWPGTPGGYQPGEQDKPKPSGGAGKKQGSRYGGSKQKDEPEKKVEEGKPSCGHTMEVKGCKECAGMWESKDKPSAGLSKAKKSAVAKKAKAGGDIGKPGKGFEKVAKKAAAKYGSKEKGEKVAAAAMWKNIKRENIETFKQSVRVVNESLVRLLAEDEEGKAKAITAAGDMVNDYTSWMQRVGQYQTKSMIELADAIRADFGAAEAEAFKQAVGPALTATLETLTQQREAISQAVAVLAGEAAPTEPMGMEPGADMAGPEEPGLDTAAPDEMNPAPVGDEFAASDAAAGAGTPGREMRESQFARKLAESHSIISKLAK